MVIEFRIGFADLGEIGSNCFPADFTEFICCEALVKRGELIQQCFCDRVIKEIVNNKMFEGPGRAIVKSGV